MLPGKQPRRGLKLFVALTATWEGLWFCTDMDRKNPWISFHRCGSASSAFIAFLCVFVLCCLFFLCCKAFVQPTFQHRKILFGLICPSFKVVSAPFFDPLAFSLSLRLPSAFMLLNSLPPPALPPCLISSSPPSRLVVTSHSLPSIPD